MAFTHALSAVGSFVPSFTQILPVHPAVILSIKNGIVFLEGPLGTLHFNATMFDRESVMALKYVRDGDALHVSAPSKCLLRTFCSVFTSAMKGVTLGFTMHLEAVGTGYKIRVEKQQNVIFRIGLSHPVSCAIPSDIRMFAPKPNRLVVFGIDKQRVHEVAAKLRDMKPPEPYKGKGLRRTFEVILRKEGKKK